MLAWGSAIIWACWSAGLYLFWLRRGGLGAAALAAALGLLAAAFAALPLSLLAAIASWALAPPHSRARDLERYDAARSHVRPCDVCRLTLGDGRPKAGVSFCPKCEAWVCEGCRRRYDLRALAALKRRVGGPTPRAG